MCRAECDAAGEAAALPAPSRREAWRSCATAVTSEPVRHPAWRVLLKCTASREGAWGASDEGILSPTFRPRECTCHGVAGKVERFRRPMRRSQLAAKGGSMTGEGRLRRGRSGAEGRGSHLAGARPPCPWSARGSAAASTGLTRLERSACWAGAGGRGEPPGSTRSRALCRVAEARFEWGAATWYW